MSMNDIYGDVLWEYYWEDGACLKLYDTPNYYTLVEYGVDGSPVSHSFQQDYSSVSITEDNYPKDRWSYEDVLTDIQDMYDL